MSIDNTRRRPRNGWLALLMLVLGAAPAAIAQGKEMPLTGSKEALALYMQGREKAENLEDPGMLFEQAIQKDPNFAMGYLSAGRSNMEFRKNLEKAAALAGKVSPGEREWIMAVKAQSDGNLAAEKEHLDNLLKLYPGDKRAQTQMAFYYRSIGDDATALRYFNEAARLDKNYAPVYNNIGYSNMGLGKYADAEAAFKTYITLIPKNPNPYDSYAELLMKTGKFDDSIAQYNKALSIDPAFISSYRGIGDNYSYKGDYAKAREAYKQLYEKAPNDNWRDQAMVSMLNSYVAEGSIDKAIEVNDQRLATAEKAGDIPAQAGIHSSSGFILLEAGKMDDAARHFDMAAKLAEDGSLPAPVAENMRFWRGIDHSHLLIARGEFAPANAQLQELRKGVAARKNPNQERAWNEAAGLLELKQKNYAKAIEYFSKSDPNNPYVLYHKAMAYEGAGNSKMAMDAYMKVANWNALDDTGYSFVRSRAMARGTELAKTPQK